MNKYFIILPIALIGLTGLFAFWQVQIPNAEQMLAKNSEVVWKSPQLPKKHHSKSSYNKLRKLNPWGNNTLNQTTASSSSSSTKTSSSAARRKLKRDFKNFVGIIHKGKQRYILFTGKKKQVTQYHLGNQLPNGANLTAIHEDFIEVKQDGQTEIIHLYH